VGGAVPVVQVGTVGMLVRQPRVPMAMGMGLAGGIVSYVLVLLMLVVNVRMFVVQHLMLVGVLMPFGQVQLKPDRHQAGRRHELPGDRLCENGDDQQGSDERRRRGLPGPPARFRGRPLARR
jgi:hypothetical protein